MVQMRSTPNWLLVLIQLVILVAFAQCAPLGDDPFAMGVGLDPERVDKRPDYLSVNRDLASIANMMRLMKSDRIHSTLIDIGKRDSELLDLLYRYHWFNNIMNRQGGRPEKKNQLSVDMPLNAISGMLQGHRMRGNQRMMHTELLKIGKRDVNDVIRS